MADQDPGAGGTSQEALIIWLKIAGMIAGICAFGLLVFWLRRSV